MDDYGQTSMEYLVIVAVVVLIAALVAFTATTFADAKPDAQGVIRNYTSQALKVLQ